MLGGRLPPQTKRWVGIHMNEFSCHHLLPRWGQVFRRAGRARSCWLRLQLIGSKSCTQENAWRACIPFCLTFDSGPAASLPRFKCEGPQTDRRCRVPNRRDGTAVWSHSMLRLTPGPLTRMPLGVTTGLSV